MSIHVILGKPGSGKSLYATSRVIQELREGSRNIVTNLPLRPDRLNEYLQQKWPKEDLRMVQRLRVLNDDEIKQFWLYRGPEEGDKGEQGVAYFLDEAHIAFNARDWATIGRGALHYLSQHRKLGDIVWPITQSPGNLDKQFRSVAEDFTVLRNEYTAKFGIFRGRGRFVRRTYLSEPSGNAEPFEVATFTLDTAGIASCYDTAKGIGVHGSKADIGRRAKGIPIWTVVPVAVVLALSTVAVPWLVGKGVRGYLNPDAAKPAPVPEVAQGEKETSKPESLGEKRTRPEPRVIQHEPAPSLPSDRSGQALWVTGYVLRGDRLNVTLSDGRTLTESASEIKQLERNGILLQDGSRIWLKQATSGQRAAMGVLGPVLGSGAGSAPVSPDAEAPSVAFGG